MNTNRREFLRRSIAAALGGAGLYSALGNLQLISSAAAQTPGFGNYKALVCVYLHGGNDAFNTIVPVDSAHYASYAASRGALAVARDALLPIAPLASGPPGDGASYGLHPAMTEMTQLFQAQRAAIVANVGTLLYPITREQFLAGSVPAPAQLFSHADQSQFWQTSRPADGNAIGWGGRVADLLHGGNTNQQLSMAVSLSGDNLFQRGNAVDPYIMNPYGVPELEYVEDLADAGGVAAYDALRAPGTQFHMLERTHGRSMTRAIDNYRVVNSALGTAAPLTTVFPAGDTGAQFRMIARLLSVRSALAVQRQIFFVGVGDFDTHGSQAEQHAEALGRLSSCLKAFYDATVELGIADNVTTFTASDFGRTLSINGDGTDHGWGGHQFVIGGAVHGQRFYGRMPSLVAQNNPDDSGYGQLIPTLAVEQYAATLARWFGVPVGNLADIFPNLGRFSAADLGFLA